MRWPILSWLRSVSYTHLEANKGYTRILELTEKQVESGKDLITVQDYNYDKFFDALRVANTDKWDDKNQTYTSWRPLGNEKKRTDHAVSNAKASDMVRQFAITWYCLLYTSFDDKDEVNQERDGAVQLYEGGEPYAGGYMDNPVLWDGFRKVGSFVTDENGYGSQTIQHRYHYDKTFCDGHPAPVFVPVPEPEEDEETGEVLKQGEIDAAQDVYKRQRGNLLV